MTTVSLKGSPVQISGSLPNVGKQAPAFTLTNPQLEEVTLETYSGKKKILNINPSLDTGICALSAKAFNKVADEVPGTVILNISRDTPFAAKRFCAVEDITKVVALSEFTNREFGADYGIEIQSGPLNGALGRAIVVLDQNNTVVYTELVPEITQEPDYDAAIAAVQSIDG